MQRADTEAYQPMVTEAGTDFDKVADKPDIEAPKPPPNPFKSKFEIFAANAARIAEEKKKADEA